jgi:hypothetical protein
MVKPWKETLDVMLFADQLLSNPRRCFRLDHLVLLLLFFLICWTCVASALSRHMSLRDRPCQGTAVRDLVALRGSRSRAATPHLHPRTPEPRALLARIALLLMCLNPPCAPLLTPGRSPPLAPHQCFTCTPRSASHLPHHQHLHALASCRQLALLLLWHRPCRAHSLRLRSPAPL